MLPVFIGTEDAQWLPTEVLKHSILRRTKAPIEFRELKDIPLDLKQTMYTGFSFYRFTIPEKCGFQGRAVYLDADIVVLSDIQELFDLDMKGKGVLARTNYNGGHFTSVMLHDCEKLKNWKMDKWLPLINGGVASYHGTLFANPTGVNFADFGPLDPIWNGLEEWSPQTKILHYTHVPTQPWKKAGNPLAWLYLKEMKATMDAGKVTRADVEREIAAGFIYPKILEDMEAVSSKEQG